MSDYEEDLMKRIDKESNGAFEEIFKAIYSDQREEGERVDQAAAQKDANVNLKFEFMWEFRVIGGFLQDLEKAVDYKQKDVFRMLLLHQISHRHCKQVFLKHNTPFPYQNSTGINLIRSAKCVRLTARSPSPN